MSSIKVEGYGPVTNAVVYGLSESIKRAKYPMSTNLEKLSEEMTPGIRALGVSDKGEGHDQWLTGVTVQFDLTFTNKAWVEFERYRFAYFISSQSTMHRITSFDLDKAYNEYVDKKVIDIMKEKIERYNSKELTPDEEKELYLEILYTNPAGFKITAGITTNYRQLKTIYSQRKYHRLPEWREFCRWIETLPEAGLITGAYENAH